MSVMMFAVVSLCCLFCWCMAASLIFSGVTQPPNPIVDWAAIVVHLLLLFLVLVCVLLKFPEILYM